MSATPTDQWKTSNYALKPERADQYSLGYFMDLNQRMYETSLEVYYKKLNNIIDYRDGATLIMNENLEEDLLQGIGRAYGAELLVKKATGKMTGWFSYTYSRILYKIEGDTRYGTINLGDWYPANYDKPNDLTVTMNYQVNQRFKFGANFVYSDGKPITWPVNQYWFNDQVVFNFEKRNQERTPSYHRLDISFSVKSNIHKKKKFYKGEFTFSIYNLYGRKNPYSVYITSNKFFPVANMIYVIGTPVPSISYSFEF